MEKRFRSLFSVNFNGKKILFFKTLTSIDNIHDSINNQQRNNSSYQQRNNNTVSVVFRFDAWLGGGWKSLLRHSVPKLF